MIFGQNEKIRSCEKYTGFCKYCAYAKLHNPELKKYKCEKYNMITDFDKTCKSWIKNEVSQ